MSDPSDLIPDSGAAEAPAVASPVVDSGLIASVSFAPGADHRVVARPLMPQRGSEGHALIGVGPGRPGSVLRAGLVTTFPFPVTGTKIHPPLLRSDTLSRPRLTTWLDRATRGRVALIVAEAGFGKTTLLADWASRTPRRTAWYRLETDDADWLIFLRHLVASGRELDPDFATDTLEMLLALGAGGPNEADIIATLVQEFVDFGAALPDGLTLIFDDYHAIDGSAETEAIMRALIDRTSEEFSIIVASRSAPDLRLGRLRSRGSVSRLDGDDLCFDIPETDRLFREAYNRPLEPDVVAELIKRTDGWAALLTLVRTSLEDKDQPGARALVQGLSAARGDLYDFLAEEVVATLSPALQHFLTRVSILVSVDAETGSIVDELPAADLASLIAEAETLGLLTRPDREAPHRFHPLVQGFLVARLTDEIGESAVRALHRRVATALEASDWLGSAWHYRAAGDPDDAARVIDIAVPSILAAGGFELAAPFLDGSAGRADRPAALILRSRIELSRGSLTLATELARRATVGHGTGVEMGTALLNLASLRGIAGYGDDSVRLAVTALEGQLTKSQIVIARAIVELRLLSQEGDLEQGVDSLRQLATQHIAEGMHRYAAITLLNLASTLEWTGRLEEGLEAATHAEIEIMKAGSRGVELTAIMASRAGLLTLLGRSPEADQVLSTARDVASQVARDEAALETARIKTAYGSRAEAEAALATLDLARLVGGYVGLLALVGGELAVRRGDSISALAALDRLGDDPCHDTAGRLREQILRTRVALMNAAESVDADLAEAGRIASIQKSAPGVAICRLLAAVLNAGPIDEAVVSLPPASAYTMSIVAEEISRNADRLSSNAMTVVAAEAQRRPERWREPMMRALTSGAGGHACAGVIELIGSPADAFDLRALAVSRRNLRSFAKRLTVRLASPVDVGDLGRIEVLLGGERIPMARRKVLALLCYLGTRPGMAATRDEVLDALWPELGPDTASNSLHQTIYFLRRVFEPDFREGMSAGYVTYDGEVVSVSEELVDSDSRKSWRILRANPRSPAAVTRLLDTYTARFAIDFAYEEWAIDYRDHLHAAVLASVEPAIASLANAGDYDAAIDLAHRVLAIDAEADGVELTLLRNYKASGRHAAAAEQYSHYAAFVRDELGAEPPTFDEI